MGKEWVAFIPITPTIPPAYIVPLGVNPGRKRSSKHITLKAMKQNDKRFCKPLRQASTSQHTDFLSPPPLSSWRGLFCVTLSTYVYLLYGPAAAGTADEYGHWLLPPSLALPSSNTMGLIVHATHTHRQRGLYSGAECRFPQPYAPSPLECDYLPSPSRGMRKW